MNQRLPKVATMATMPSRRETFEKVLPAIHAQADRVFVFLDGYDGCPDFLNRFERVVVRRADAVGDLHASSRLLCLRELDGPSVVAIVDDDVAYPPDYLSRMTVALERHGGDAIVGVHGRIFTPPHASYARDAIAIHFAHALARPRQVHELGTGTCAFLSDRFSVDPLGFGRGDMDDILLAIAAQKQGLPRFAIARPAGWLKPLAQLQADSLWRRVQADDSAHTERMRDLLRLYL